MTCPDLDRLIDLYHGLHDPELGAHVKTCPSCQADLNAILLVPVGWGSDVELPAGFVEGVLAALPMEDENPERVRESLGQRLVMALLCSVTAVFGLVALGSAEAGGLMVLLSFSLTTGAVIGIVGPSSWILSSGRPR